MDDNTMEMQFQDIMEFVVALLVLAGAVFIGGLWCIVIQTLLEGAR